jgi:hypothetical protein
VVLDEKDPGIPFSSCPLIMYKDAAIKISYEGHKIYLCTLIVSINGTQSEGGVALNIPELPWKADT